MNIDTQSSTERKNCLTMTHGKYGSVCPHCGWGPQKEDPNLTVWLATMILNSLWQKSG
jgi:hypothetical protein